MSNTSGLFSGVPNYTFGTTQPQQMTMPGDGWYAEFSLNSEVSFLRVLFFIIDGTCPYAPNPQVSVYSTYPRTLAMVPANQAIVPAFLVPGFVKLVHETEFEEEEVNGEEDQDTEDQEDDYEDEGEEGCDCEGCSGTFDPE